MSDIIEGEAVKVTLDDRVEKLEKQVNDLIVVMSSLNLANKELVAFINGIPTNGPLLKLLLDNMIALHDGASKKLEETGAYDFSCIWDTQEEVGTMRVECVRSEVDGLEVLTHYVDKIEKDGPKRLESSGEGQSLYEFIVNSFTEAGYGEGQVAYAKFEYHTGK